MSLLASPPDGLAQLGWRRVVLTALIFCLVPAVMGGGLLLISLLFQGVQPGDTLGMRGIAVFAIVTPLFTAPIWAMIALASVVLLRIGRFGWLSAALVGLLAFGVLARTEIGSISLLFGAASTLLYRMALALQRPEAI